MTPHRLLRVEGLAALGGSLAVFAWLDGPVWLLAVLALAPDLSMLAYLAGPRVGSIGYNLLHTYTAPLLLGGVGGWADVRIAALVAAVWAGHIGADRLSGCGLTFDTGFADTHLSTQPAPVSALAEE